MAVAKSSPEKLLRASVSKLHFNQRAEVGEREIYGRHLIIIDGTAIV